MRVLVVGGTGFVGTALVEELHDRGHEVTALSRDPDPEGLPEGVETVAGDATRYESIEAAFEDQDAVVNLVALSPLFRPVGGDERHDAVHRGATEQVVRAAEAHGVDRLVQMSGLGADPDAPTAHLRAKGRAEDVVRESDLSWVILRPSVIFGDGGEFVDFTKLLAPPYLTPLPGGGLTRFQPIWIGDVAPMLADAVEGTSGDADGEVDATDAGEDTDPGDVTRAGGDADAGTETDAGDDPHAGRTYEVGGPEVLTLAEVARLAHAADGRPVNVVPVPMALAWLGLRTLDLVPASVLEALPGVPRMGVDQYRALGVDNTTDDNDVVAFGVSTDELTTLAEYLGLEGADAEQQ